MRALTWLAVAWACATGVFVAVRIQAVPALVIPVILCAVPLFTVRPRTRGAVLLLSVFMMLVFVLLTSLSMGWFYVPCLIMLILARILHSRQA